MRFPVDNYGLTQGWNPPIHYGLDLAKGMNVPILSPVTGKVIGIGTDRNYIGGLYIIIREDDPEGLEYYTGHHDSISVKVGQRVTEGQQIAKMGVTGTATGPHTHFQIRKNNAGALIDPNVVLKRKGDTMQAEDVVNMYRVVLGREPDAGGLKTYTGMAYGVVFYALIGSKEYKDRQSSLASTLEGLKTALLNEKNRPPTEVVKIVEKLVDRVVIQEKIVTVEVEPTWLVKVRDFILGFLKLKKG